MEINQTEVTKRLFSLLDKRKQIMTLHGQNHRKDQTCNAYRAALKDMDHPWRAMQWDTILQIKESKKARKNKRKLRRVKHKKTRVSKRKTQSKVEWLPRDEWEKQTTKFYNSRAWRELRYKVLRDFGGSCSCCGARASDGVRIHVDHIKPRSKYPELQLDKANLQVLCEDCNFGKSNYYNDDWRVKMGEKP